MGAPKIHKNEKSVEQQEEGMKKRRFRFRPEPSRAAMISFEINGNVEKIKGLIVNESYSGCCLVILNHQGVEFDRKFRVEITGGLVLNSELRWMKKLGDMAMEVGFEYVE